MQEWFRRQKTNRRYSLRAFANSLAISPSRLSDFFNGKGGISASRALEIMNRLHLSEEDNEALQLVIQKEMPTAQSAKRFATKKLSQKKKKFNYERSLACRKTIDRLSWEHLYITELISEESLHQREIAKRLKIHTSGLSVLLAEAQEMQLIEPVKGSEGFWRAVDASRRFGDAKASVGIRKLHFQMLKQIPQFCESCDNSERELSTSLLQLNQKQIETLSQMIREFVKTCLAEANKKTTDSQRLCGLSVQLYPIENNKGDL